MSTREKHYTLETVIFDAFSIISQAATEEPKDLVRLESHIRSAADMLRRDMQAKELAMALETCANKLDAIRQGGVW